MAYGKGTRRETLKRIVDLGRSGVDADLAELRQRYLAVAVRMTDAVFPDHISDEARDLKALDAALLAIQKEVVAEGFLNSVWAEKVRLSVKASIAEQVRRGQKVLFGRFKNIGALGEKPDRDGKMRLINLPKEWSDRISEVEIRDLQVRADGMDFRAVLRFFRELRQADGDLSLVQAGALRAMMELVQARFGKPEKNPEGIVQLHLDARCVSGGASSLLLARERITEGLTGRKAAGSSFSIAGWKARGAAIPISARLSEGVSEAMADRSDQELGSFVIEIGPSELRVCGVVNREKRPPAIVGAQVVLAEDYGLRKTSSVVVVRSAVPIGQEVLDFIEAKPGKAAVKARLSGNVSGDEIEVLESRQMDGTRFLDAIKARAGQVDQLRSEIDLCYNRLERIRREMNRIAGEDPRAIIPAEPSPAAVASREGVRYLDMHRRFFRLLEGIGKLKEKRRDIYRKVAAVKTNWLGHVGNIKIALAEKHGAVVVGEDLTILAIPKDDPAYKGRTFNKMINNGAKGQYIRRSDNKMTWRGIASIRVPSFWSSVTDWRNGTVDKAQRKGPVFRGHDGTLWDADLHAAEMLARWLFLRPRDQEYASL